MPISTINTNSIADDAVTVPKVTDQVLTHRNLIINGAMQVAQRGTSFTADNVFTLDRWKSGDGTGGTPARTLSQQTFTLGQTDVPNAHYYLRHNQTGASTNGNSSLVQKIEDVTRFDGQTVTISFYAKADASMNINIRFIQDFGTGGSPSADVDLSETVTIGTSWTRYTVTKTLGSLSGKTLGTDGTHTSCLTVNIDFQPTTTFVFDATLFQLEVGDTATPFEHRSFGEELALCQRYYFRWNGGDNNSPFCGGAFNNGTSSSDGVFTFPVRMRIAPTALEQSGTAADYRIIGISGDCTSVPTFLSANVDNIRVRFTKASSLTSGNCSTLAAGTTTGANAFLGWSAEL